MRLHPHRHAHGVGSHHPAADHHHPRRLHTRDAAQQDARATLFFLQAVGAGLYGHAPRHFAHGRQQGQAVIGTGDGLVGDGDTTGIQQRPGLPRVGCQVQVGKQHLALPQHGALPGLGLLDLDHHLGPFEHLGGAGDDLGPGLPVQLVAQAYALPRAALHDNLVPVVGQLVDTARGQADPVFMGFYFFWYTDQHGVSSLGAWTRPVRKPGL